jgi:Tfp pilus assembly protein PilF
MSGAVAQRGMPKRPGRQKVHCPRGGLMHATILLGLVLLSGCAGWREKLQSPTVTASREERAAAAVREFEQRRDSMQFQAAIDRWNQGDTARAETMLAAIVSRRPDHLDARLRLAEVLWSHRDASAESHLRAVLAAEPERAEAHHAIGLLLDGTGQPEEAQQHLLKATELEPENETYRLTFESLAAR